MKILVLQVQIGRSCYNSASYYSNVDKHFEQVVRPSVVRYCNKHSYDYQLVTECPEDLNIEWFHDTQFPDRNISSTLIRYNLMHNENYDAVVSLDNDIYVTDDAEPLPRIVGHMGVHDIVMEGRRKHLKQLDDFMSRIDYSRVGIINGGVQMVDREMGKTIQTHFKNICDNQIPPTSEYYSDQSYINELRSKMPEKSNLLDDKWNFIVDRHIYDDHEGINFVHYSGRHGRKQFYKDCIKGLIRK
jgi:hypothetical protein